MKKVGEALPTVLSYLASALLLVLTFGALYYGSYSGIDALHRRLNEDYAVEEVHYYITQDDGIRSPRLTEIASAALATLLSPAIVSIFMKMIPL